MVMPMSSANPWSSYHMYVSYACSVCCVGVYPMLPMESYLRGGSIKMANRNGESVSPYGLPPCMAKLKIVPYGVM